jgi:iron(III) transport system substrate-binding protein
VHKIPPQYVDKEHYWTGLYIGVLAFVASDSQLEKRKLSFPTSWQDLLKPEYKGNIQIANPGTSGTGYNIITSLVGLYGESQAMSYLKKLHKNISQYTRSGVAPVKNTVLGETVLAVGYSHDAIRLIYDSKAALKIGFPTEGTGFEIASVSMLKGAKQPELAKKLYDFLLTREAAQILADDFYAPFIRDGVKLKSEIVDIDRIKLIQTDMEWDGKNKDRLVELWNDQINS